MMYKKIALLIGIFFNTAVGMQENWNWLEMILRIQGPGDEITKNILDATSEHSAEVKYFLDLLKKKSINYVLSAYAYTNMNILSLVTHVKQGHPITQKNFNLLREVSPKKLYSLFSGNKCHTVTVIVPLEERRLKACTIIAKETIQGTIGSFFSFGTLATINALISGPLTRTNSVEICKIAALGGFLAGMSIFFKTGSEMYVAWLPRETTTAKLFF